MITELVYTGPDFDMPLPPEVLRAGYGYARMFVENEHVTDLEWVAGTSDTYVWAAAPALGTVIRLEWRLTREEPQRYVGGA